MAHTTIYEAARLYDLAFSYRDFAKEALFLKRVYMARHGHAPANILELAAGPARHALEMAAVGASATALDIVPEMAEYARRNAIERKLELDYRVCDMTRFESPTKFELAACMLCSATYLLTDRAFDSHLRSVHAALVEGGMYVLELPHPAELEEPKTKSTWTMRDAMGELAVQWSENATGRDGNTWLADVKLEYRPLDGSAAVLVEQTSRQRKFTREELEALASRAGFSVQGVFGALNESVALDDQQAWRMVIVLEKVAEPR
jgi:SAM-dependent methyltransferase